MISLWHLVWIVPVAAGIGMFVMVMVGAGRTNDEKEGEP